MGMLCERKSTDSTRCMLLLAFHLNDSIPSTTMPADFPSHSCRVNNEVDHKINNEVDYKINNEGDHKSDHHGQDAGGAAEEQGQAGCRVL